MNFLRVLRSFFCAIFVARRAAGSRVAAAADKPATMFQMESTTMKFFGPQYFLINATSQLRPISLKTACFLTSESSSVISQTVVSYTACGTQYSCSAEIKYKKVLKAGALAAIINSHADPPGFRYWQHDGTRGSETSDCAMPALEISLSSESALKKLASGGETIRVLLTPTQPNRWVATANHPAVFFIMRVILPVVGLWTGWLAYPGLRQRFYTHGWRLNEPFLVLAIEFVVCPLIGLVRALSGFFASDMLPWTFQWFMRNSFSGIGVFTTLTMVMYWRRLQAIVGARRPESRNSPSSQEKSALVFLALLLLCGDFVVGTNSYSMVSNFWIYFCTAKWDKLLRLNGTAIPRPDYQRSRRYSKQLLRRCLRPFRSGGRKD